MSRSLVLGLSGQIGAALLPRLLERNSQVLAISRHSQPPQRDIEWRLGSLEAMPEIPPDIDCVLSLGPLDAFVAWFVAAGPNVSRVVAIGSTGRRDKLHSLDANERDTAQRLVNAEAQLFEVGRQRGIAVTVLRPTLLYGGGRDQTLSPLLKLARRFRMVLLPATATGLRQPVHVADVADAVVRCWDSAAAFGHGYDLPGAETLSVDAMVRRAVERHAPGCRVLSFPTVFFRIGLALAGWFWRPTINRGLLQRLRNDQVADPAPAIRAFGYRPRRFDP
ncbi:MAG: nucleoside-diphosphate sugar epimerase [Arenimonas sp.]